MKKSRLLTLAIAMLLLNTVTICGQEIQYETEMGTRFAYLNMQTKEGVMLTLVYSPSLTAQKIVLPALSFYITDAKLHNISSEKLSYMKIKGNGLDDLSLTLDQGDHFYELRDAPNRFLYSWDNSSNLSISMPFVCANLHVDDKFYYRPEKSVSTMNKRVEAFFRATPRGVMEIHTEKFTSYTLELDESVFQNIRRLMDAFGK